MKRLVQVSIALVALTGPFGCGRRVEQQAPGARGAPAPVAAPPAQLGAREAARRAAVAEDDLEGSTRDLTEARGDLANAAYELRRLVSQACGAVPPPNDMECPVSMTNVTGVRDATDGVIARISTLPGQAPATAQSLTCYHARVELRAAERGTGPASSVAALQAGRNTGTAAGLRLSSDVRTRPTPSPDIATSPECLLDVQGLEIDITPVGSNQLDVHLIADSDAELTELRRRARELERARRLTGA